MTPLQFDFRGPNSPGPLIPVHVKRVYPMPSGSCRRVPYAMHISTIPKSETPRLLQSLSCRIAPKPEIQVLCAVQMQSMPYILMQNVALRFSLVLYFSCKGARPVSEWQLTPCLSCLCLVTVRGEEHECGWNVHVCGHECYCS